MEYLHSPFQSNAYDIRLALVMLFDSRPRVLETSSCDEECSYSKAPWSKCVKIIAGYISGRRTHMTKVRYWVFRYQWTKLNAFVWRGWIFANHFKCETRHNSDATVVGWKYHKCIFCSSTSVIGNSGNCATGVIKWLPIH